MLQSYVRLVITVIALALSTAAAGHSKQAKQYATFKSCEWPQFDSAVQHFSELLQFHTVGNASHPDHADPVVWELLDMWMHETYADVLETMKVEKVMS